MVSRCVSIRQRKNLAQFLAALRLKSTATFCKKRKLPTPESPDQPHPKRAALNRTLSAPAMPIPSQEGIGNLNRQSPNASQASSSQQPFLRCFSTPVPEACLPVTTRTPTKPPVAGKPDPLPARSREPSPDAQRVKILREMMIQLNKQWDEFIRKSPSSEQEEDAQSHNNDHFPHKGDSEASQESDTEGRRQESLWVETNGERLTVHLKCPCTKGYQVVISGDECYYKHASF